MGVFEVRNLIGSSYIIPGPTNIGLIKNDRNIVIIDSGNDKDSGRKIRKYLDEKGWKLNSIINTHSNADHIGGNDYLQRNTNCKIYSTKAEKAFIETPIIEASFLWGGYPNKDLWNKFFIAESSQITDIIAKESVLLDGSIRIIELPGHFFEMIGVITSDKVAYIGDSIFDKNVLDKYKIPFVYNVKAYKETIIKIKQTEAIYYVMSHGEVKTNINEIAEYNMKIIELIEEIILDVLRTPMIFEKILKAICDKMLIELNCGQYALVGSTIKSFLSYLNNENKIKYRFESNEMIWSIN